MPLCFCRRHSLSLPSTLHGLDERQLDAAAVVGVVALDALPPFVLRRKQRQGKAEQMKKNGIFVKLLSRTSVKNIMA